MAQVPRLGLLPVPGDGAAVPPAALGGGAPRAIRGVRAAQRAGGTPAPQRGLPPAVQRRAGRRDGGGGGGGVSESPKFLLFGSQWPSFLKNRTCPHKLS